MMMMLPEYVSSESIMRLNVFLREDIITEAECYLGRYNEAE